MILNKNHLVADRNSHSSVIFVALFYRDNASKATAESTLNRLHEPYTFLQDLQEAIPHMPFPVKKALLTLTRIQFIPSPNTRAWKRMGQNLNQRYVVPGHTLP